MGIIGTVMGLVHVLQNLSNPSTLGPAISTAFIATLLGVGAANVIFLPVGARLRALSSAEAELRILTVEGILSVQAGDNPRVVGDKLRSFVAPAERGDGDERAGGRRGRRGRAEPRGGGRVAPCPPRPRTRAPPPSQRRRATRTRSAGCSRTPT